MKPNITPRGSPLRKSARQFQGFGRTAKSIKAASATPARTITLTSRHPWPSSETTFTPTNLERVYPTAWMITAASLYLMPRKERSSYARALNGFLNPYVEKYQINAKVHA
jgi:hypothetical protein